MNFKSSAALIGILVLPLAVMAQNVAVVNGKPVPVARVDALIKTATHGQEAPPELKAQARDQGQQSNDAHDDPLQSGVI